MKLTYQKPAYRHIALDGATSSSGCSVTNSSTPTSCPVTVGPYTVFVGGSGVCKFDKDSPSIIMMYGGELNNVFNS